MGCLEDLANLFDCNSFHASRDNRKSYGTLRTARSFGGGRRRMYVFFSFLLLLLLLLLLLFILFFSYLSYLSSSSFTYVITNIFLGLLCFVSFLQFLF